MKRIIYYFNVWFVIAKNTFLSWTFKKGGLFIFLLGKVVRYVFYFLFLYFLVKNTNGIGGFGKKEVMFFAVTYLFVDVFAQFLFRNVYTVKSLISTGDLDLILSKPVNPLFRILFGGPDFIDLITLPPIIFIIFYLGQTLNPTLWGVFSYLILLVNAILISAAFHIMIVSVAVITLEIDNVVMIYRDILSMGRFPIDIYKEPVKSFLTLLVPVGVMTTLPAKVFLGLISPLGVISAIIFGIGFFGLSIKFWQFALKQYTSASS